MREKNVFFLFVVFPFKMYKYLIVSFSFIAELRFVNKMITFVYNDFHDETLTPNSMRFFAHCWYVWISVFWEGENTMITNNYEDHFWMPFNKRNNGLHDGKMWMETIKQNRLLSSIIIIIETEKKVEAVKLCYTTKCDF